MTSSWKAEVQADNTGTWASNMLRFETQEEAALYARDLFSRWMAVKKWQTVPSSDAVTHRWVEGAAQRIVS
jgi:hypothetical protein